MWTHIARALQATGGVDVVPALPTHSWAKYHESERFGHGMVAIATRGAMEAWLCPVGSSLIGGREREGGGGSTPSLAWSSHKMQLTFMIGGVDGFLPP